MECMMCKIRNIEEKDIRRVAEIHVKSWQVAYKGILPQKRLDNLSIEQREETWRKNFLSKGARSNYVLEVAGDVRGWISVGPSRDEDANEKNIGELYGIYLDPRFYGIGYGTRLWHEARRHLRAENFYEITLWVLDANERARKFYEKIGFSLDEGVAIEMDWMDGARELRYRYRIDPHE